MGFALDVDIAVIAFHALLYNFPIDEFPNGLKVVGAPVAVVYVIGMFPDINCQQRAHAVGKRVACIAFVGNLQIAAVVGAEPRPSSSEKAGSRGLELFFERLDRAECLGEFRGQKAAHRFGAGGETAEVEFVVPDLGRIVVHAAVCLADDLFQFHFLIQCTLYEFVQVVYIRLQMFPVVEVDGLGADDRRKGIFCVWQKGHKMFHCADVFVLNSGTMNSMDRRIGGEAWCGKAGSLPSFAV